MRPSRDDMLKEVARVVAERSTCERAHVGAVVARQGRILVTGYNGAPAGMPHCNHEDQREYLLGDEGSVLGVSYSGPSCTNAVHAEANAIAWAARHGISLTGAELFTTMSPCLPCAQLVINAGITRVIYNKPYRIAEGLELLSRAKIELQP